MTLASADTEVVLLDTSAAVALCVADHEHHALITQALSNRTLGLAGHAAFETYSVLTRLPPPARRPATVVAQMIRNNFPESRFLPARAASGLLAEFAQLGIAGGSVYDGLVGAAARAHGLTLVSLDERAFGTYRALGVDTATQLI